MTIVFSLCHFLFQVYRPGVRAMLGVSPEVQLSIHSILLWVQVHTCGLPDGAGLCLVVSCLIRLFHYKFSLH